MEVDDVKSVVNDMVKDAVVIGSVCGLVEVSPVDATVGVRVVGDPVVDVVDSVNDTCDVEVFWEEGDVETKAVACEGVDSGVAVSVEVDVEVLDVTIVCVVEVRADDDDGDADSVDMTGVCDRTVDGDVTEVIDFVEETVPVVDSLASNKLVVPATVN